MTDIRPDDVRAISDAALREMYPRLRRLAAVAGPAEVAPDDLVQEAFEKLFAHGVDGVTNVEGYLRRIIVNTAANHRRRLGRGRRALHRFGRLREPEVAVAEYPSDLFFLRSLSPQARAVLFLHEVEGFDLPSIGEELGMTHAAVKQLALRSRRQLRRYLQED